MKKIGLFRVIDIIESILAGFWGAPNPYLGFIEPKFNKELKINIKFTLKTNI